MPLATLTVSQIVSARQMASEEDLAPILGENPVEIDPVTTRDVRDPGDQTQRNFRYQHLYGVILLAAAACGSKPYIAVWCEHYEDFLCEHSDGSFDGVQVKTKKPELGPWKITDPELVKTIGRFVDLSARLGSKLRGFYFISNAECDHVTPESQDQNRRGRCPKLLLTEIRSVDVPDRIGAPFKAVFDQLQAECGCSETDLFSVLRRMDLVHGPSRNEIEAAVSNEHLAKVSGFESLASAELNRFRDQLVAIVHRASSLQVTDPNRHLQGVVGNLEHDPALAAKRLVVVEVMVPLAGEAPAFQFQDAPILTLGRPSDSAVLDQKLIKGGLGQEIDYFRSRGRGAEYALMEDIVRRPQAYPALQTQIEQVVLGAVSEAHLRARSSPAPFGSEMLIGVQDRLKAIATQSAAWVGNHGYDCLIGVAAMLTSECRVWWSERFEIEPRGPE